MKRSDFPGISRRGYWLTRLVVFLFRWIRKGEISHLEKQIDIARDRWAGIESKMTANELERTLWRLQCDESWGYDPWFAGLEFEIDRRRKVGRPGS